MNYKEFASDLPLDGTIVFRSAEENEEEMQRNGVNQEVRQIGTGKFRSDLAVRSTEQADLFVDRFNKAVLINLEPPKGAIGVLFPRSASGQFLASGQNVGNEKMLVFPDGSGTDIVLPDLAGSEAMTIPTARFTAMAEVLSPTFTLTKEFAVMEGNTAQLHALKNAVLKLVAHPELQPNDEQLSNLLAAIIAWIADCQSQAQGTEGLHVHTRTRIAKLAQAFIEAHHQDAVRMEDLCRVTSVGLRTLQRCFKEYFDLTITDYLKTVRLNAAYRELTSTHPLEQSVSNIALRHGFNHLGRFSVEFRTRFGKSPKEMLAMRAG